MKKIVLLFLVLPLAFLSSCGEYNAALKHGDAEYKYEVAKACYMKGQYGHAQELFSSLLVAMKGSGYADECLYMMAMSSYMAGDLETASASLNGRTS